MVWQKADELAMRVYKITENFPPAEEFGLKLQIRRAAVSVPANIVEGYGRRSKREFRRFLDISLGSLAELEYLIALSARLGFIKENLEETLTCVDEVGKLLWSFRRKL